MISPKTWRVWGIYSVSEFGFWNLSLLHFVTNFYFGGKSGGNSKFKLCSSILEASPTFGVLSFLGTKLPKDWLRLWDSDNDLCLWREALKLTCEVTALRLKFWTWSSYLKIWYRGADYEVLTLRWHSEPEVLTLKFWYQHLSLKFWDQQLKRKFWIRRSDPEVLTLASKAEVLDCKLWNEALNLILWKRYSEPETLKIRIWTSNAGTILWEWDSEYWCFGLKLWTVSSENSSSETVCWNWNSGALASKTDALKRGCWSGNSEKGCWSRNFETLAAEAETLKEAAGAETLKREILTAEGKLL